MGICPRGTPGLAGLKRLPRGRTSEGHGCREETLCSTQRARRGPSQPPKAARTCWRAAWAGAPSFSLPAHLDSDRQQPRGPAATENHLVSSSQALRVAGTLLPPGAVSPCVPFSDQWSHGDELSRRGWRQGRGPRQNASAFRASGWAGAAARATVPPGHQPLALSSPALDTPRAARHRALPNLP